MERKNMNISKSLWVVLVGVSLCLANISGIVTDTGSTPIPGAVVQLEQEKEKGTEKGTVAKYIFNPCRVKHA
jgi:hypothetical protein